MLTQERLKHFLEYRDGSFYRRIDVSNVKAGTRAGCKSQGYEAIYVDGKPYRTHRLVWLYFHGYFPKLIDHKDHDGLNNRIENLREATCAENMRNSLPKIGHKGVGQHNGKWRARICINYKYIFLGHFPTKGEALEAYNKAALELHGEFACLNVI